MAGQALQARRPLALLDGVAWHGVPITGQRARTLLAVLVAHAPDGVSDARLVEEIWGDGPPANPTKALQVVVSRARSATYQGAIVRTARGYRLGLDPDTVDVLALAAIVDEARARLADGDIEAAQIAGQAAICYSAEDGDSETGALGTLRREATEHHRQALRVLGMACSIGGDHEAALDPLRAAVERDPDDEPLLACLLRSEAAARGTGAALERYEHYRAGLAERTGADPGPDLRRLHGELLAAGHRIRQGLRFEATELLGRDEDVRALRVLLHESRIVSTVGPGGLGKTRLAHVIGRGAEAPVVRMVELVGVTAPEDVVGELGSVLGVRDSVASRRSLTPEQRADVRSRIAAHLDRLPTLLILDNCEHVIDAVAELVTFLVASARHLRVLTTSRAPLGVVGERVYALDQLGVPDAAELFRQRAAAVRPGAVLPEAAVTEVVVRLDGLPLAIELAAAKVRVMAVEDVAARLGSRFALLRGGDRCAPDRHQTLLAVIDWSWNLLAERERFALRWMSVFHDGFSLPAAEAILGADALEAVQSLADQSLVTVRDTTAGTRYAMLETVREFGRMQLVDAGEDTPAHAAQRRWAREYARSAGTVVFSPEQFAAMALVRAEETNLADVLRRALADRDPDTVVILLAALAGYWTVAGDHERLLVLTDAVDAALDGWTPPPELADEARLTLAAIANTQFMIGGQQVRTVWALLRELGPESDRPGVTAMTTVTLASDPERGDRHSRLLALCEHPDRLVAALALLTCSHELENAGDPAAAIVRIERSLAWSTDGTGPWLSALLRAHLAGMQAQLGRHHQAAEHARAALPVLEQLDAIDDAAMTRSLLATAALTEGRLDDAEHEIDEIHERLRRRSEVGDDIILGTVAADLELARGHHLEGLRRYRDAVHHARELRMSGAGEPTGTEPWTLFVCSAALCAYARYGTGDDGADLFDSLAGTIVAVLHSGDQLMVNRRMFDYPIAGLSLFGLALWGLYREALPVPGAVRLAVLADRFGYNRMLPTTDWEHVAVVAERAAPGLLARIDGEYGDRRGEALLDEARSVTRQLLTVRTE